MRPVTTPTSDKPRVAPFPTESDPVLQLRKSPFKTQIEEIIVELSFLRSNCGGATFRGSDYRGFGEWMIFVLMDLCLSAVAEAEWWCLDGWHGLFDGFQVWVSFVTVVGWRWLHGWLGLFDGFRVYYVAWWDLMIVIVFVLGCDFGFAGDASIYSSN